MVAQKTAKALRAELLELLVNGRGMSSGAARSFISGIGSNKAHLLAAILDNTRQGFVASAPVDQAVKFDQEQRKKTPYTFQIELGRLNALRAIADADGASVSHHIRQAVADYLKKHAKRLGG
jgi:hypothetical protein